MNHEECERNKNFVEHFSLEHWCSHYCDYAICFSAGTLISHPR